MTCRALLIKTSSEFFNAASECRTFNGWCGLNVQCIKVEAEKNQSQIIFFLLFTSLLHIFAIEKRNLIGEDGYGVGKGISFS